MLIMTNRRVGVSWYAQAMQKSSKQYGRVTEENKHWTDHQKSLQFLVITQKRYVIMGRNQNSQKH